MLEYIYKSRCTTSPALGMRIGSNYLLVRTLTIDCTTFRSCCALVCIGGTHIDSAKRVRGVIGRWDAGQDIKPNCNIVCRRHCGGAGH